MARFMDNSYLTPQDLMSKLGLGRTKVYEIISTPGFPAYKFNQLVRIPEDEFEHWLESNRINRKEAGRYGRFN